MPSPTPSSPAKPKDAGPSVFGLLKGYRGLIALLVGFALTANALTLTIPRFVAQGIDRFAQGQLILPVYLRNFALIAGLIFVLAYLQSMTQTYLSERVAKDLRDRLAGSVARQSYADVQETGAARLMTSFTGDIDSIKMFVAQGIVTMVSSIFMIIGASILLIHLNWKLGLAVLAVLPVIAGAFGYIFANVGELFKNAQQAIDRLNKVINESILGATLIRVVYAPAQELQKFLSVNEEAKTIGFKILRLFASLIPVVTFLSNIAILIILLLGGHYVITGELTLGSLSAFNGYIAMLIFPILMLGFMSSLMGRAAASYGRLNEILTRPPEPAEGALVAELKGKLEVKDLHLTIGQKAILKNVSFTVEPGTKTAILGPTAAGKTQLLSLLTGLMAPTGGEILYDGKPLSSYDKTSLLHQVGFVFQDSALFHLSLRENIAFSETVTEADLQKAIKTAELQGFIETLPDGLNTAVSERGLNLSGGQKQRIMLARALALNPKVLLLDDFTARVDIATEQRILQNVFENYPGITLISVTQKLAAVEGYEQVILLMEGEVLATGTHRELLASSPEYQQIHASQQSTNHYEVRAE